MTQKWMENYSGITWEWLGNDSVTQEWFGNDTQKTRNDVGMMREKHRNDSGISNSGMTQNDSGMKQEWPRNDVRTTREWLRNDSGGMTWKWLGNDSDSISRALLEEIRWEIDLSVFLSDLLVFSDSDI